MGIQRLQPASTIDTNGAMKIKNVSGIANQPIGLNVLSVTGKGVLHYANFYSLYVQNGSYPMKVTLAIDGVTTNFVITPTIASNGEGRIAFVSTDLITGLDSNGRLNVLPAFALLGLGRNTIYDLTPGTTNGSTAQMYSLNKNGLIFNSSLSLTFESGTSSTNGHTWDIGYSLY